jgi:hypothetical protein
MAPPQAVCPPFGAWALTCPLVGWDTVAAGDEVPGRGSEDAQRVRFAFANGVTAEDSLEDGIASLRARSVVPPPGFEILDERGVTLAGYDEGFTALDMNCPGR